jgi:excisionase family DNA binding protein
MGHVAEVEARERLLLTVIEAAAMLGVGRTKAYELIAGGELQVVHIGRAARVPVIAVHRHVEALLSPPPRTMRRAPRRRDASQPPLPFIDLTKD